MSNRSTRVYRNGKIITVDDRFSIAEALAVREERILAVGSNEHVIAQAGAEADIIDLAGRTVMPGLIDGHAHLDREGLKTVYPSLAGASSIDDILQRIESLVAKARPGEWVVTMPIGNPPSYWTPEQNLKERRWPTRHDLDQVSPNNPVYIRPIWGFWRHTLPLVSIANSRALEVCGISRQTREPAPSVTIDRDARGEPTGIFYENTHMSIVELTLMRGSGGFTHQDRVAALQRSMRTYNAVGTTSVFEEHGASGELIAAYRKLHEDGTMTARVNLTFSPSWNAVPSSTPANLLPTWGAWMGGTGVGDSYLRIAGLYVLLDDDGDGPRSPLENQLRASANPYTGWAGFHYDAGLPRDKLKAVLVEAARNDIRCVGLTSDLLELYEEVHRIIPIAHRRWVIGHISTLTSEQVARIRDLGLVVSTHTNRYIYRTGARLLDELGPAGEDTITPLATLKAAGVPFCLATDNVPVSLFHPIWHVVARKERTQDRLVAASQKISREDALRAATMGGAYMTFDEDEKGSLEAGKLADFVALDADPLSVPEDAIKDIAAEFTVVGGRTVYERSESKAK